MTYPADYPQPLFNGHAADVGLGHFVSEMDNGNVRVRKRFGHMPHMLTLSFVVPLEQLKAWASWCANNAYEPFDGLKFGSYMGAGQACFDHTVTFISDIQYTALTNKTVRASVQAIMQPYDGLNTPPPDVIGGWIIAHDPAAPSVDWVIANTPAAPSTDWTLPGTPATPAVTV